MTFRLLLLALAIANVGPTGVGNAARAPAAATPAPPASPVFDVYVFDVGTGLSVFVAGADFTLLYDAGSNDDVATGEDNRVLAYLAAVRPGMKKLDHVLISHPHKDHTALLPDVFAAYPVANLWDSGAHNPICSYEATLAAAAAQKTAWHVANSDPGPRTVQLKACGKAHPAMKLALPVASRIRPGAVVQLGRGAKMAFLRADGSDFGPDHYNWNSLVVRLDLGGVRLLLPGDEEAGPRAAPSAEENAKAPEAQLLLLGPAELKSDVVVVPHHGSKTSSRREFIDAVDPQVVVISSGPHPYSGTTLPDPEVVAAWSARADGSQRLVAGTDDDDGACRKSAAKVGTDDDGSPGGCSAVRVHVAGPGDAGLAQVQVSLEPAHD